MLTGSNNKIRTNPICDSKWYSVIGLNHSASMVRNITLKCLDIPKNKMVLAWRSGIVMDCQATTQGSIPGGNSVFTELHVLRKGQ